LIKREDMQEIVRKYKDPIGVVLGSHSALDALAGLRNYGMKGLVYVTKERASIYLREPRVGEPNKAIDSLPAKTKSDVLVTEDIQEVINKRNESWKEAILLVDKYDDILKSEMQDALLELEGIQIPNRAFSVYVGGEACKKIEDDFHIPIFGSRNLLKIENREEVEKNYYWYLEKGGLPHPKEITYKVIDDGIKLNEKLDQPVVMKIPHASRRLERGFVFAADGSSLEEEVRKEVAAGHILHEDLKDGRAEEYVPGVTANFNFFYSPIYAKEDWGDLEKYIEKWKLANELLSIDERRETTHDGILRMLAKEQIKVDWSKTNYPPSFEVTAHGMISLRESLIRKIYPIADKLLELMQEEDPPGLIGSYCVQTLITFQEEPFVKALSQGVYDTGEKSVYDFVFKTQDLAVRHGGGTNVHMAIGSQYANAKYNRPMSMGDRIILELILAKKKGMLEEIVT
jgi:5-formaminoimidazole-4-carboxamide-1-(beta)-D-ribofuranosyl 5'-monophosphate synthetase